MKTSHILSFLLVNFALTGCVGPTLVGMAAGAGATVGVAAAREGGVSSAATDVAIRAKINDRWFKYDVKTFAQLNLTVDQGRVLVTGIVQNPDARVEAVRLAWQVEGVRQVINEIRVADSEDFAGYTGDLWITTRLRTAMTFDADVQSINYSIDTVDGTVYLMGVYQSPQELKHVTDIAQSIPHVKQVISYCKHVGEPIPAAPVPQVTSGTPAPVARAPAPQPAPAVSNAAPESLLAQPATGGSLQPQAVQREPLR